MTNQERILAVMPPLARLNNWCRAKYEDKLDMESLEPIIYGWKKSVIHAAIKEGIAQLRIVAVERSCKTCKGSGVYERRDWNDENYVDYEDCRRCNATGKVVLRFVESRIGGHVWHTPRPQWTLPIFDPADWEKTASTEWTPEQPGAPMDRIEFISALDQVESIIYHDKQIEPRSGSASNYSLNLGEFQSCWYCGSPNVRHAFDIWRSVIGLHWKCGLCDACHRSCAWTKVEPSWPQNLHRINELGNFPEWSDRVPVPSIAKEAPIANWLARRQIFPNRYAPSELAFAASGHMVRVISATPVDYMVQILDSHYHYEGWLDDVIVKLHDLGPTGRRPYLPQFDWSEIAC